MPEIENELSICFSGLEVNVKDTEFSAMLEPLIKKLYASAERCCSRRFDREDP